jgi:hypothetical protein
VGGGVTKLHKSFSTRHEFNLEKPHKEKNIINVKFELVGKEKCDEQHQRTRKKEEENKDEVNKVKE